MGHNILGFHHVTLNVGSAQEDFDFHTKLLGLKILKKTVLYDGDLPIYHLYYGNHIGNEGTVITTLPFGKAGLFGKKGAGQVSAISLSVPEHSLNFWINRLESFGVPALEYEKFGGRRVKFNHPCGIGYEFVGVTRVGGQSYSNGVVPAECEIIDIDGITIDTHDVDNFGDFLSNCWEGAAVGKDGSHYRYKFGDGEQFRFVDFEKTNANPGSWTFGQGTVHHCAFAVNTMQTQNEIKSRLVGYGFVDVSEVKDRGYFDSIYVRTPSGVLFEIAVSKAEGFLIDEPYEKLGTTLMIPSQFESRRQDILSTLESLTV
ncbi:VOC family protein [Trinickia fusca]|uniref:Glyoxalase n=1 Tax=Trinickia fusca TaxID=2419777 RepID=A0A494XEL1_9BURK|nr:VOC family protein [Trinickia fusca]RKP46033.1 glyoxalase [Trinickia fusca]